VALGLDVVVVVVVVPLPLPLLVLATPSVVVVGMAPNGVAAAGGLADAAAMPSAVLMLALAVPPFWSTVCSLSLARRSSPRKREPSSTRA
jgi:hypothetical protein